MDGRTLIVPWDNPTCQTLAEEYVAELN